MSLVDITLTQYVAEWAIQNLSEETVELKMDQWPHFKHSFQTGTPFIYGSSPHNQRIESWWCILRKCFSQYWMNFFGQLRDEGAFTGYFLDTNILQLCFMKLIQVHVCEV